MLHLRLNSNPNPIRSSDRNVGTSQTKMLRVVLDEETGIYDRRPDALYSFGDAVMEAWVSGRGPLGPIGCFGLWFGILVSLRLK